MHAIVIGATGFLGSHLALMLRRQGHLVIGTGHSRDRLARLQKNHVISIPYDFFETNGADFVHRVRREIFTGQVIVFFCAQIARDKRGELIREQMKSLTRAIATETPWHFVLCSSDGVFSGGHRETTERYEPNPRTPYGENHYAQEKIVRALLPSRSLIVRMSYLFGRDALTNELDARITGAWQKISAGREVSFFEDMFKSPLSVIQAAEALSHQGLYPDTRYLHLSGYRVSVFEFFRRALVALGMDTAGRLQPIRMPPPNQRPGDYLEDTSLSFERMTELTGIVPHTIEQALIG